MIGKIIKGKSFSGLCDYILENEQAKLIDTNMVEGTAKVLAFQLEATCDLNYRVRYPTAHLCLSFAPSEKPSLKTVKEISSKFLKEMGFDNNLYFVAEHNDRDHYHIHIGASRINFEGKCVDDWKSKIRCEKILRKLEVEYDLVNVTSSSQVAQKAPSTGQVRRFKKEEEQFEKGLRKSPPELSVLEQLQSIIHEAITPKISMSDFLDKLTEQGVSTKIKISATGEIQGISYAIEKVAFAGRKLGRNKLSCTLSGLQQRGVEFSINDLTVMIKHSNKEKNIAKIIHNRKNKHLLFEGNCKSIENKGFDLAD